MSLYITFIQLAVLLAFLTPENDLICTVTERLLSKFWLVLERYNVQKELFPRPKEISLLE